MVCPVATHETARLQSLISRQKKVKKKGKKVITGELCVFIFFVIAILLYYH